MLARRALDFALQLLALLADDADDIILRGLAAEGHGAVDRRVDLRLAVREEVAPEAGRHLDDDLGVAAAEASLGFRRRAIGGCTEK